MLEIKSHLGSSIPFTAIPQYERLLEYKSYKDILGLIIVWFIEKNTVIAVPIEEAEKMRALGEKSIGLRMLKETDDGKPRYNIKVLPSETKRVYPTVDYSIFKDLVV